MKTSKLIEKHWIFLLILVFAALVLVVNTTRSRRKNAETNFAINTENSVTRIVIIDGESSVNLEANSSGGWLLNDKFQVSDDAINTFFRVASRLQNAGPVSLSVNDSLIDAVQRYGKHIEFFSKRKEILSYWILDTDALNLTTVGYTGRGETVYKLELPNYDGSIASLIKVDESYWGDSQVPVPNFSQIIAVEVDVPHEPEKAFRIDVVGNEKYRVLSLYSGLEVKNADNDKVLNFLNTLTQIPHQGIAELTSQQRAQLSSANPDFVFNVFTSAGPTVLNIFPIPVKEYTDELGSTVNVDLNRVYVEVAAKNQVFLVNYIDLYSLLRGISFLTS